MKSAEHNLPTQIRVRPMRESDVPACANIIGRTPLFRSYGFGSAAAQKLLSGALKQCGSMLYVAVPKTKSKSTTPTLGFAWFITQGAFQRSPYLRLIAVDPLGINKGTGRALLENFEKLHLQPYGIFLLVTKSNHQARQFYQKLGYDQVGEIPDYVKKGMTECIYFKPPSKTHARSPKKR